MIALQAHRLTGRVAVASAPPALDEGRGARGGHAVQRELPADQRAPWRAAPRRVCSVRGEGADVGDARRLGVVALGLRADDRLVDPAGPALVDRAEAVDEEVVADVVPAVRVAVEAADAQHHVGRLVARVVVRVHRVVDERGAHLAVLGRRSRRALVGAPAPRARRSPAAGSGARAAGRASKPASEARRRSPRAAPRCARGRRRWRCPRTFTKCSRSPRRRARSAGTGPSRPRPPRSGLAAPTAVASGPGRVRRLGVRRRVAPSATSRRPSCAREPRPRRIGAVPCQVRPTRLKRLGARSGRDTSAVPRTAAFPSRRSGRAASSRSPPGSGRNGRRESAGAATPARARTQTSAPVRETASPRVGTRCQSAVALWAKRLQTASCKRSPSGDGRGLLGRLPARCCGARP